MVMYIGFLLFIGVRSFDTTYINMNFKIAQKRCQEIVKSNVPNIYLKLVHCFYLIKIQYDITKFEFHLHIEKCLDYEK